MVCSNCGTSFERPQPVSAWRDLLAGPVKLIRLEEYLTATCPRCGHRQDVENERFLGFLGPAAIRWLVVVLVLGILVTVLFFS